MRKPCAILALTAMLFGSASVRADDHFVSREAMRTSLADAAAERTRHLALLEEALASPRANEAAAMAGLDIDKVRGSLAGLSNDEVRDLSRRAAALKSDPTAGHYGDDDAVELLVVVALIGAIALVAIEIAENDRR